MPYPDDIIATLTERFELSEIQQIQLRDSLMLEEIRPLVELETFNPENLLMRLSLPDGSLYVSVLSTIAVKQVIADLSVLESLKTFAEANFEAFREWDSLKKEIDGIHNLSRKELRLKQTRTNETYPKLVVFFAKYVAILNSHSLLQQELFEIPQSLSQYINAMTEPIQEAATQYFTKLFRSMGRNISDITFTSKKSGVQLGTVMTIMYVEADAESRGGGAGSPQEHRITYYIKTHQHGSTSEVSSVKPVDPKELFVYKVLEYIGYGPKVHFFFNPLSLGGFFIATQNLSFTKIPAKEKKFILFEQRMKDYNETAKNPAHDEARRNLVCLDILSRILRLRDTTTNPGNFGIVTVEEMHNKWKFLDFRVLDDAELYLNPRIFEGFQEGNGIFNYSYSTFLEDIFRTPEHEKRKIEMGMEIVEELHTGKLSRNKTKRKMPLSVAMERAYEEICQYMTTYIEDLKIDLRGASADFRAYFEAVQKNFETLAQGINDRYAALIADVERVTEGTHSPSM